MLHIGKMMKQYRRHAGYAWQLCLLLVVVVALSPNLGVEGEKPWEKAGCHRVGHTQNVSIPGCPEFAIFTNGCRGYCLSYAIPTTDEMLSVSKKTQRITSMGACCSMVQAEKFPVPIMCIDGPRVLYFLTAKECGCSHCKKY